MRSFVFFSSDEVIKSVCEVYETHIVTSINKRLRIHEAKGYSVIGWVLRYETSND